VSARRLGVPCGIGYIWSYLSPTYSDVVWESGDREFAPAISSLGPVVDLSGEMTASADLFVGDFGVTGFFDAYGNPSFFYI
jgi:hypothetical protein